MTEQLYGGLLSFCGHKTPPNIPAFICDYYVGASGVKHQFDALFLSFKEVLKVPSGISDPFINIHPLLCVRCTNEFRIS
jgi:hypothetical protein